MESERAAKTALIRVRAVSLEEAALRTVDEDLLRNSYHYASGLS